MTRLTLIMMLNWEFLP